MMMIIKYRVIAISTLYSEGIRIFCIPDYAAAVHSKSNMETYTVFHQEQCFWSVQSQPRGTCIGSKKPAFSL